MIEALRGPGYSTATALADIIDNSISAGAGRVDVTSAWAGAASTVRVLDDGSGMRAAGLDTAMRPGEINPLATRTPDDLGRIGLRHVNAGWWPTIGSATAVPEAMKRGTSWRAA